MLNRLLTMMVILCIG